MTSRSVRAPEDEPVREQSHADIIRRIDLWREESRTAHAELKGEMRGRFDGVDREIQGLRGALERTTGRVAVLEGDAQDGRHVCAVASGGVPPDEPEHGLPFGKGWARRLALAGIAVAILGGLGSAIQGIVNVVRAGGAAVAAFLHTLTPPPVH